MATLQNDPLTVTTQHAIIRLQAGSQPPVAGSVSLYLAGATLLGIDTAVAAATRTLIIEPAADLPARYLAAAIAAQAGAKVAYAAQPVPANLERPAAALLAALTPVLTLLGVALTPTKRRPAKAQHRWRKAVATVPFTTTFAGTQATVYWQRRNEMRLLAGARLKPEADLNADGSLGFSARFAAQLRGEHQAAIGPDFVTTEDVVLKSTNEVGLFLYFGTTNSWLQFADPAGRTLDDWTVVR
ncbi:hypothetical protein [Lacticaseibacillus parakribbianus]|uniref:hypothetical protein n=1 Tax=Lacticaseibacillus parakribbianus TaxID=2970927 RepID=UPI0021CB4CA2|nr:hypothetical protein [Lacticaseibacillus parakribbianus]